MSRLEVQGLTLHHGELRALHDFSLTVEPGQTVAVIGANGAGKSTLLAGLAGLLPPSEGTVRLEDKDITRMPAHRRVPAGISLVPEGRRLFKSLTVEENLLTGQYRARKGHWDLERIYELFEWMPERRNQAAWQLSGGEQQGVAIGRALLANPQLLLIDELSLGLAPAIVRRIYKIVPTIVETGTSVLIVEQDVAQARSVADQVLCLLEGRTMLQGRPEELSMEAIEAAYFGVTQAIPTIDIGTEADTDIDIDIDTDPTKPASPTAGGHA